jgi:carbon monoxide dehydrogenase subunit G
VALQFEHAFVIKAPPDRVWAYLTDPRRVAPALPGASISEQVDERTWSGGITVKVGPVSAKYKGTVRFESLDPGARTAVIVARGQDTSGRGGADMRMTSRIAEKGAGESEVSVASVVSITGIMAQFGRGLMQDVSDQMLQRFTEAMRAELERPDAEAPAPAASAVAGPGASAAIAPTAPPAASAAAPPIEVLSFGSRLLLRRPAFWITVTVLVLLAFLWKWMD